MKSNSLFTQCVVYTLITSFSSTQLIPLARAAEVNPEKKRPFWMEIVGIGPTMDSVEACADLVKSEEARLLDERAKNLKAIREQKKANRAALAAENGELEGDKIAQIGRELKVADGIGHKALGGGEFLGLQAFTPKAKVLDEILMAARDFNKREEELKAKAAEESETSQATDATVTTDAQMLPAEIIENPDVNDKTTEVKKGFLARRFSRSPKQPEYLAIDQRCNGTPCDSLTEVLKTSQDFSEFYEGDRTFYKMYKSWKRKRAVKNRVGGRVDLPKQEIKRSADAIASQMKLLRHYPDLTETAVEALKKDITLNVINIADQIVYATLYERDKIKNFRNIFLDFVDSGSEKTQLIAIWAVLGLITSVFHSIYGLMAYIALTVYFGAKVFDLKTKKGKTNGELIKSLRSHLDPLDKRFDRPKGLLRLAIDELVQHEDVIGNTKGNQPEKHLLAIFYGAIDPIASKNAEWVTKLLQTDPRQIEMAGNDFEHLVMEEIEEHQNTIVEELYELSEDELEAMNLDPKTRALIDQIRANPGQVPPETKAKKVGKGLGRAFFHGVNMIENMSGLKFTSENEDKK
ncbi:MAG: hypothetical protein AB7F43_08095 [Bacteriovoracia bacterium]